MLSKLYKQNNSNNNYTTIFILLFLLFLAIVIFVIYRKNKQNTNQNNQKNIQQYFNYNQQITKNITTDLYLSLNENNNFSTFGKPIIFRAFENNTSIELGNSDITTFNHIFIPSLNSYLSFSNNILEITNCKNYNHLQPSKFTLINNYKLTYNDKEIIFYLNTKDNTISLQSNNDTKPITYTIVPVNNETKKYMFNLNLCKENEKLCNSYCYDPAISDCINNNLCPISKVCIDTNQVKTCCENGNCINGQCLNCKLCGTNQCCDPNTEDCIEGNCCKLENIKLNEKGTAKICCDQRQICGNTCCDNTHTCNPETNKCEIKCKYNNTFCNPATKICFDSDTNQKSVCKTNACLWNTLEYEPQFSSSDSGLDICQVVDQNGNISYSFARDPSTLNSDLLQRLAYTTEYSNNLCTDDDCYARMTEGSMSHVKRETTGRCTADFDCKTKLRSKLEFNNTCPVNPETRCCYDNSNNLTGQICMQGKTCINNNCVDCDVIYNDNIYLLFNGFVPHPGLDRNSEIFGINNTLSQNRDKTLLLSGKTQLNLTVNNCSLNITDIPNNKKILMKTCPNTNTKHYFVKIGYPDNTPICSGDNVYLRTILEDGTVTGWSQDSMAQLFGFINPTPIGQNELPLQIFKSN